MFINEAVVKVRRFIFNDEIEAHVEMRRNCKHQRIPQCLVIAWRNAIKHETVAFILKV